MDFQVQLLDVAFKAASAFPEHPHLKNRCRNQEAVVEACFQLDQPRRALGYVEKIQDWRRGKGFADFAVHCARHGDASEVQRYADLAEEVAEATKANPDSQDWQIDRIRVTIAQAHAWLGDMAKASELEAGTAEFEARRLDAVKAQQLDPNTLDREIEALDHVLKIGNFEQICSSIDSCAELYGRFYADADRRTLLETKIRGAFEKLPPQVRVETLTKLFDFALDHGDRMKANALARDVQTVLETTTWQPEDRVAFESKLASLYFRAGDEKSARSRADGAHELYQSSRTSITSIFRGKALRPLAEAYHTLGSRDAAMKIYKQALEESLENPNSRPRADDLCALCCSMAVNGFRPDDALMRRVGEVCAGLREPW